MMIDISDINIGSVYAIHGYSNVRLERPLVSRITFPDASLMVDAPAQQQLRYSGNPPTLGVFHFSSSYGSFPSFNRDRPFM